MKKINLQRTGFIILVAFLLILSTVYLDPNQTVTAQEENYQLLQRIKIPAGYKDGGGISNLVGLSPDGKKVVYCTHNDSNNNILILNEFRSLTDSETKIIKDFYYCSRPVYSPDNQKVAWILQTTNTSDSDLICNSDTIATFPNLMFPTFSPNSQHLACIASTKSRLSDKDNKYFVILDGKKYSPDLDYIVWTNIISGQGLAPALVFNADGSKLAYLIGEGYNRLTLDCKKYFIMVNDQKIGPNIYPSANFLFSADNELIYVVKNGRKYSIYMGETKISPDFSDFNDPLFPKDPKLVQSPDGNKVAYKAKIDGKSWVMINDQKIAQFQSAEKLVFSPDSRKLAYTASKAKGKWSLMLNEEQISPDFVSIGRPVFSPDGAKIAYSAQNSDKSFAIMVNDQQTSVVHVPEGMKGSAAQVDVLGFSPDGSKVIYKVTYGVYEDPNEIVFNPTYSCLMVNDRQITPLTGNFIVADYKFRGDGIYFVGYYLDLQKRKDGSYTIYSNKGELIYGFASY